MESIEELRKICYPKDYKKGNYKWFRRYSVYFTRLLLILNLTPNQVTALWVAFGVIGATLLFLQNYYFSVLGTFIILFGRIFDYCDGSIARYKKQYSNFGIFLDWIGTWVISFIVIIGIYFYSIENPSNFEIINNNILFMCVYLMFVLYFCDFLVLSDAGLPWRKKDPSDTNIKKESLSKTHPRLYYIYKKIAAFLLIDWFFPFLFFSILLNLTYVFLIWYSLAYTFLILTNLFKKFLAF